MINLGSCVIRIGLALDGLTHCGLEMPYGDKEFCQNWFR